MNLEKSVESQNFTQSIDAPSETEKLLITNKVTTDFSRMEFHFLARHLTWFLVMVFSAVFFPGQGAWAKGEITEVLTELRAAKTTSYTKNGAHYQWGLGNDLLIKGFYFQGNRYDYQQIADRVVVNRVANPRATGHRCSVFAETAGGSLTYAASYPATKNAQGNCDMAQLIASNVINAGALDIFSNEGATPNSIKNIERVDFVLDKGLLAQPTVEGLALSGQVVIEKAANNPLKIAAITSLDTTGKPNSYGSLITIHPAESSDSSQLRYGEIGINMNLDFLSSDSNDNPGRVGYWGSRHEGLGMVFISQADLGLSPKQRYFGFSLFPSDVDPKVHSLTDPATFPKDSKDTGPLDPGDADFFAAFALPAGTAVNNLPPTAIDDFLVAVSGESATIDLLVNDSDPEDDPLQATLLSAPLKGSVTFQNGILEYLPSAGASGKDEIRYRITDGHGGEDTALLTISIPAVIPSASGRIATGLKGHGAGGFNFGFLVFLSALMAMQKRRKISG